MNLCQSGDVVTLAAAGGLLTAFTNSAATGFVSAAKILCGASCRTVAADRGRTVACTCRYTGAQTPEFKALLQNVSDEDGNRAVMPLRNCT